jgi:hypothetical protein
MKDFLSFPPNIGFTPTRFAVGFRS